MKKIIIRLLCLVLIFILIGCVKSNVSKVKIDYGTSSVYSEDDRKAALDVIICTFGIK